VDTREGVRGEREKEKEGVGVERKSGCKSESERSKSVKKQEGDRVKNNKVTLTFHTSLCGLTPKTLVADTTCTVSASSTVIL
jgi:hypothetical protein